MHVIKHILLYRNIKIYITSHSVFHCHSVIVIIIILHSIQITAMINYGQENEDLRFKTIHFLYMNTHRWAHTYIFMVNH